MRSSQLGLGLVRPLGVTWIADLDQQPGGMEEGLHVGRALVKENLKSRLGLGRRGKESREQSRARLGISQTSEERVKGEWVEGVRDIEMGRAWGSLALKA